ncbi:glycosyltransferase family 2 protein [Spirosoma endophyticum]|uniref:Glycosyltransferase involved in cell wall bisynthesis n=1 Tax=Spirosoma endophyticum TaxID=662367 RepID=A0A1I1TAI2_9BACT|nr:glycosyltransferase family 2 protein [Spirosoma endophyticum]SFD55595.1 Glycosyltransferase involved in cell wall bisynthesis [Spirosoma endophyticum]
MNNPLISVITVVFNAGSTLEFTLKSVLSQDKDLFDYWIIDGGSTDGSIDIIRKYESQLAGWISEPDKGIFDAMNKGIDKAKGDWLFFLGADDILPTDVFAKIAPYLQPNLAVVYGNVLLDNGAIFRSHIGIRCLFENRLHHQSAFYHKRLFDDFRYNQKFKSAADYELTLRIYSQKQPSLFIPYIISIFSTEGYSSSAGVGVKAGITDANNIRRIYLKNSFINFVLSISLKLYYPYMHTRGKLIAKLRKVLKMERIKPNLKNVQDGI